MITYSILIRKTSHYLAPVSVGPDLIHYDIPLEYINIVKFGYELDMEVNPSSTLPIFNFNDGFA